MWAALFNFRGCDDPVELGFMCVAEFLFYFILFFNFYFYIIIIIINLLFTSKLVSGSNSICFRL